MRKILAGVAMIVWAAGIASATNPCGNNGNNCCTDDGGDTYISTYAECTAFCSSVSEAVAVAVSACEATAAATCIEECNVPTCLDWKVKYNSSGFVTRKICLKVSE